MKHHKHSGLALLFASVLLTAASLSAAEVKSYQVTGPVLEVSATSVTVQKGAEKWQVARNASTKVTGDLKVGSKVTIYYTMVAAEIEVKDVKEGKDSKGKK